MPANLDYALYFNILFFGMIGLGFLGGYFRGFKKTLWKLITLVIFYGIFFLTIDAVVTALWTLDISFAMTYLTGVLPNATSYTNLGEVTFAFVENFAGDQLGDTLSNDVFISLVTGLTMFVLKIIYAIIYFTIGRILYKIITYFFYVLFLSSSGKIVLMDYKGEERRLKGRQIRAYKKEEKKYYKNMKKEVRKMSRRDKKAHKKEQRILAANQKKFAKKQKRKEKKPLLGALAGTAKGAVTAFVGLIMLGGLLNITESFLILLPSNQNNTTVALEPVESTGPVFLSHRQETSSTALKPVLFNRDNALVDLDPAMQDNLDMVRDLVNGYNDNLFVEYAYQITIEDENYASSVPLNLYLFDSVLSFQFDGNTVMLRNELDVVADTAGVFLNSDFTTSNDISDITGAEVEQLFINMSNSDFITSLLPLALEVGSDYFDVPLDMPTEDLYAIDWQAELQQLGAVVATGFDLVNTAGLLDGDVDLTTVTLEGEDVRDLFDELAESELVTLGAYVALEPFLEQAGGTMSAVITVPEGMEWDNEIRAFGEVAEAVLDTGITVGELQGADPSVLIGALSEMDFTILLNSDIVSYALKNIFDGTAGIEGLDLIVVPDDIEWFDEYDDEGNLITAGELRNILAAVNEITTVAADFDFNNLSLNVIADFENDTIDALFNSEVLVATISDYLLNMDLGTTPLLIPDSVLDVNNYLLSSELKAIASSAKVLVTDLACDEGDTACEDTGFDISKAFSLSETAIDTLTTSDILAATIGNLILDQGGTILTVPTSALSTISVDSINQDVVSKAEIKKLFQAVGVLGFDDLENMAFDASIINNLGEENDVTTLDTTKSSTLFGSKLVHATLSQMLFDQASGAGAVLNVPYFSEDSDLVREYNATDDLEYVANSELDNLLQGLLTLNITDFANVDSLDISSVIADADTLLDSSILQATISKQIYDLGDATISVPHLDANGDPIRISVGDQVEGTDTEYIKREELVAVLDSLELLGLTDIGTFDGTVGIDTVGDNLTDLLASATLHATISKQLVDLGDSTLTIPDQDVDEVDVIITVGTGVTETTYVSKAEIEAMFDALEVLGITDVTSFTGGIDLTNIYVPANQDILLSSASMHATITKQMVDLGPAALTIPDQDIDENPMNVTVAGTYYIVKDEIKALISSLEVLGIDDVTTFDGTFDFNVLATELNQDTLLSSASIHATITDKLLNLGSSVLIVPNYDQNGETPGNEIRKTVSGTEFVVKAEIKALINAFTEMGYTDLDNFGGALDSSEFFANKTVLLTSSSIQATLSDKMLNGTSGALIVPDTNVNNAAVIRIVQTDVTYIDKTEIEYLIDGLDALGLTDFTSMSFDPTTIFSADFSVVLQSASLQATISDNVLAGASDETTPVGTTTLIIPTYFRENITVGGDALTYDHVEKVELQDLLEALDALGLSDFGGSIGADIITGMTETELDTMFESGSVHTTVDNMLRGNGGLIFPELSEEDALYKANIITEVEIRKFITAVTTLGQTNFATATFNVATLQGLSTGDRDTVADAMITRATLHTTVETAGNNVLIYPAGLTVADYEEQGATPFLIKSTFLAIVDAIPSP
jgi:hypothetical protein